MEKHTRRTIAFHHPSFPGGGAERITMDIAKYITQRYYKVFVLTNKLNDDFMTEEISSIVEIVVLPPFGAKTSEALNKSLKECFEKYHFDIFVEVGGILPTLRPIADKHNCKLVFAHHSEPLWEENFYIEQKKKKARKSIWEAICWNTFRKFQYNTLGYARKKAIRKNICEYEVYDVFTVLCNEYKSIFEKALNLPEENKIIVMNNPEYEVKDICYDKQKIVLFVGRLTHFDKRPDLLLKIWQKVQGQLPEWQLKIVGEGPERKTLQNTAYKLGLERYSFEGFQKEMAPYYRSASILCNTSQSEGWGLCLTEAQANAVIPIAFACSGGVKEIISPSGTNGFLVTPGNIDEYADTLVRVATLNPEKQQAIRHNIVEKSKKYAVPVIAQKWLDLFESLIKEQGITTTL